MYSQNKFLLRSDLLTASSDELLSFMVQDPFKKHNQNKLHWLFPMIHMLSPSISHMATHSPLLQHITCDPKSNKSNNYQWNHAVNEGNVFVF